MVVLEKARLQIARHVAVVYLVVSFTDEYVNVVEPVHQPIAPGYHQGKRLACQAVVFEARRNLASNSLPSPKNYGATVHAPCWRCKRRLEVRGFEPLAFSLRTRRSTS